MSHLGHLVKPYFKFITLAEAFTSPIDLEGNDKVQKIYSQFKNWDPAFAHPTVQVKLAENPKAANAYLKITYKNGWTNVYAMKDYNQAIILQHMKNYSEWVELDAAERDTDGDADDFPMVSKLIK